MATTALDPPHARTGVAPVEREPHIVAESPAMRRVLDLAERVAPRAVKVLITGESGVGKDLVARYIHHHSRRISRPFVAVNCAAMSETLLESELFGHVRGSFTGAHKDKLGKLQVANGGTLFLDEVGEMSPRMQALLLRALETGEIQPVGSEVIRTVVDVRVIAATNRDLTVLVAKGAFRQDLLYRIRVAHLEVPPLRERPEDLRALIEEAIERSGRHVQLTVAAQLALERHRWPGNVRELQNVLEQIIWTSPSDVLDVQDLPASVGAPSTFGSGITAMGGDVAEELFYGLVDRRYSFWEDIHVSFLNRDITRQDLREVVRRGLATAQGNYHALLELFGLPETDYKKLLNFLAAHDCSVDSLDFRPSRTLRATMRATAVRESPPLSARLGTPRQADQWIWPRAVSH